MYFEDGCWILRLVVWSKFTDVSEVLVTIKVISFDDGVNNPSETSVNFHQTTQRNICILVAMTT
jgi:hypothetical protein